MFVIHKQQLACEGHGEKQLEIKIRIICDYCFFFLINITSPCSRQYDKIHNYIPNLSQVFRYDSNLKINKPLTAGRNCEYLYETWS